MIADTRLKYIYDLKMQKNVLKMYLDGGVYYFLWVKI